MISSQENIRLVGQFAYFLGQKFPCSIGRNGINNRKVEGDGTTPSGVFNLSMPLVRLDRVNAAFLHCSKPIRRFQIWSDDPSDPRYNSLVAATGSYPFSHEKMWRADHVYDVVIPVEYNWSDPVKGAGSAIFIHRWRGQCHPTEGCIAFAPSDLMWIVERLTSRTRLSVTV